MKEYRLEAFRQEGDDLSATFSRAVAFLKNNPGNRLTVEPGEYLLTSPLARETQRAVMAGEYGANPQRTMFNPRFAYTRGIDLNGLTDTEIVAEGVRLTVDGFMEPVTVRNCKNLILKGFSVDHLRKPFTKGIITSLSEEDGEGKREALIELNAPVSENTPLCLRNFVHDPISNRDFCPGFRPLGLDSPTLLRAAFTGAASLREGMEFYTVHTYHSRPALLVEYSSDITVENFTIHNQPGMGIVGNRSENLLFRRVSVIPSEGDALSTNTDATHFTSIKGFLTLEDCVAVGQGDDLINCHGYFHAIVERVNENTCYMQEKTPDGTHAQTLDYPDEGDTLELTRLDSLQTVETYRVTDCTPLPEEWRCLVTLDKPLPENTEGLVLADVTRLPFLTVRNCTDSRHFARGALVKTRGALVENCTFTDIQGPAVYIAAEAYWYEGVCPADVTVRGCRMINCGWKWGNASGIEVVAASPHPDGYPIRNILLCDNEIIAPNAACGISVSNTEGLTVRNNRISVAGTALRLNQCTDCKINEGDVL